MGVLLIIIVIVIIHILQVKNLSCRKMKCLAQDGREDFEPRKTRLTVLEHLTEMLLSWRQLGGWSGPTSQPLSPSLSFSLHPLPEASSVHPPPSRHFENQRFESYTHCLDGASYRLLSFALFLRALSGDPH